MRELSHDPERAFSDRRPLAVGVFGRVGRRHAPALINRGYGRSFFWDGRIATLEEQVLKPIQDSNEMDLSLDEASSRIGLSVQAISQALATYIRSILSGDSPYDRFINGDRRALTDEQQRGMQIFRGRGNCTAWACADRPSATNAFITPASRGRTTGCQDEGRANSTFKTPTFREVGRTAPYMPTAAWPRFSTSSISTATAAAKNPSLIPIFGRCNSPTTRNER